MKHRLLHLVLVLVVIGFQSAGFAAEPAPQADALLQQIQAMKPPALDESKREDQKYIDSYVSQMQQYEQKRHELIKEFFTNYPDRPEAMKLMGERWMRMAQRGQREQVLAETKPILAKTTDPKDRAEILFVRAAAKVMLGRSDEAAPFVNEFLKGTPDDERGGELLLVLAQTEHNPAKKIEYLRKTADQYANTEYGKMAKGLIRQAEGVGKPFELVFKDAITSKEISVQRDLKGKVVVIDFWATWCGPCVAEMPHNKEIYATYKNKGVEFIGVSLDEPEAQSGLTKLKEFVKKNEIAWPQYYQGDVWAGAFSSSWGINSVPTVFIVDKQGILTSVNARGALTTMIPQLLAGRNLQTETHEPHE